MVGLFWPNVTGALMTDKRVDASCQEAHSGLIWLTGGNNGNVNNYRRKKAATLCSLSLLNLRSLVYPAAKRARLTFYSQIRPKGHAHTLRLLSINITPARSSNNNNNNKLNLAPILDCCRDFGPLRSPHLERPAGNNNPPAWRLSTLKAGPLRRPETGAAVLTCAVSAKLL